jgi:sulfite reductase beta subunit-like hemoprotein
MALDMLAIVPDNDLQLHGHGVSFVFAKIRETRPNYQVVVGGRESRRETNDASR